MKTFLLSCDEEGAIERALRVLAAGGLVAFPTDTVYGLGADLAKPEAVERLYLSKGRERQKAIAVLIASMEDLGRVAKDPPQAALRLASHFWPGALTLILAAQPHLGSSISPNATVGVRVPDHAVARALLSAFGPLAVTSANPSGAANARTAQEVVSTLGGKIDLILDGGKTPGGRPSTVVDCTATELRILREGPIQLAQIHQVLNSE
jgi:L-threonylcarbamoyladenylate synthase